MKEPQASPRAVPEPCPPRRLAAAGLQASWPIGAAALMTTTATCGLPCAHPAACSPPPRPRAAPSTVAERALARRLHVSDRVLRVATGPLWQGLTRLQKACRFEGLVKDDKCHVRGVFKYSNGDRYEGEFVNNNMGGFGVYVWGSEGSVYRGQWSNSMMQGCG